MLWVFFAYFFQGLSKRMEHKRLQTVQKNIKKRTGLIKRKRFFQQVFVPQLEKWFKDKVNVW